MHSQKVSKSQGGVYKFWRTLLLCSVSDQAPRSKVERPTLPPSFAKNSCWSGYAFHFPESARSILPYLNNNERERRVLGNRILFNGTFHVNNMLENREHYACATRPTLPADRFHSEMGGRFAFTWYRCEISHRSETLAPVREPGELTPGWLVPA